MAKIKFYDVHTHEFIREFTGAELGPLDYTPGLHGSCPGTGSIRVRPDSENFLNTLKENSHFMKVSKDGYEEHGVVVKNAVINRGRLNLRFGGWSEFMETQELMAAHKANSIGEYTKVNKDDPSWSVNFASDSTIGVFYLLLKEQNKTIAARGLKTFMEIGDLLSYVDSSNSETFSKVFRLNSIEVPTFKSVMDKVFEDNEMDAITVKLKEGDTFGWTIGVLTSYNTIVLNVADGVRNITFEESDDVSRSYSLATGTDLSGDTVLSKINFDGSVAYSSYIATNPSDKTTAIDRINRSSMADADKRKEQISFTVFNTMIGIQDVVELYGTNFPLKKIVITQMNVNGREVTYTGTVVTDTTTIVKGISKPTSELRRSIYRPLGSALGTAKEVAFKQPGSTGWRA
jgi:hypothetical protein